jgi:hypothetical protein
MSTTDEDVEMLRDIRAGFSSTGWHTATTDPNSWPAALDRAIQALEQERETVNGAIEAVHDAAAEVVMLKRRAEAAEERVRTLEAALKVIAYMEARSGPNPGRANGNLALRMRLRAQAALRPLVHDLPAPVPTDSGPYHQEHHDADRGEPGPDRVPDNGRDDDSDGQFDEPD